MLNVLIIGCGNIAGGFDEAKPTDALPLTHAGAYRAHGGFHLAACVDPDEERRTAFASRWEVYRSAASLAELGLCERQFDVVSICSPTRMHDQHLAEALALKPRLVFAEKPLTGSAAQTENWVKRYAAEGVLLAVNHTRRWAPDVVALRRELAAGRHGAVRSASAVYTKGVVNNGAHMIDLIGSLLGSLELVAVSEPVWDHWHDDPSVPALLRSGAGVPVTLNIGHAADYAMFELRLVTENCVIDMVDGGMSWSLRMVGPSPDFPGYRIVGDAVHRQGQYIEAMSVAAANIEAAIRHGAPLACDGAIALTAQQLCDAIRSAALVGRT